MKKVLCLFLSFVMLVSVTSSLGLNVQAAPYSGICGNNVSWSLNSYSYALTISGSGAMTNFESASAVPWKNDASRIRSVTVNSGVTNVGNNAFNGCTSLTSASIAGSATTIGSSAFQGCTSLTSVTMGIGVTRIGIRAFYNCTDLPSITITDGVTKIEESAFENCKAATSVTIPASLSSLGNFVFRGCTSLQSISVAANNEKLLSDNGVLFNKAKTTLIQYPIGSGATTYTVPNSVTRISNASFRGCTKLTSVTIPSSVTAIEVNAFFGCSNIKDVYYGSCEPKWNEISKSNLSSATKYYTHSWDMGTVTQAATCQQTGLMLYTCVVCATTKTEIIPVTSHNFGNNLPSCTMCGIANPNYVAPVIPSTNTTQTTTSTGGTQVSVHIHTFVESIPRQPACNDTGEKLYTCSTCGYSYTEEIPPSSEYHAYAQGIKQATCISDGRIDTICELCGHLKSSEIIPATGKHTYGSNGKCIYCGSKRTVTVAGVKYTLNSSGDYVSSKAKKASIKKLKKGKKSIKVTLKKASGVKGYQIQYSTSKKFTKKTTKSTTINKNSAKTPAKTIKKLKSKKTYYVRVRTYKTTKVNGKSVKVYSNWSKVKSVKTK